MNYGNRLSLLDLTLSRCCNSYTVAGAVRALSKKLACGGVEAGRLHRDCSKFLQSSSGRDFVRGIVTLANLPAPESINGTASTRLNCCPSPPQRLSLRCGCGPNRRPTEPVSPAMKGLAHL